MTVFNIEKFNTYMTTILDDEDKEEAWKSEEHQKKLVEILKECGAKFSKKKKKKKKNGPKRGRNAYIFFCSETRKELKASNPDLPLREITSMLGKRWQELKAEDGDDFNRFKQLAEEDRERYRKEKKEFSETEDSLSEDSDSDSDKKKKKKKKKNGPKRGKNAYIIYSGAMRKTVKEENPQLNPAGVVALLGKMWKDVKSENGEEYKKYTNLANADKERYLREVEELKSKVASDEEDVDIEVENDLEKVISEIRSEDDEELEEEETMPQEEKPKKKKKKEKKKKEKKKKKKKKVTPYLLYAKSIREKIREENPDMTGDEIMLQLSQNWKNMETEEKNNWKKMAKEMEEGLA